MRLDDRRTLQLGPLWVLSALVGTHAGFARADLAAFWDAVVATGLRSSVATQELLRSLTVDRDGLVGDFELDDRSVVSGLYDVVAVLGRGTDEQAVDYKRALLWIGAATGRARGPYGTQLSIEDLQRLLLVAQLVDYSPVAVDAA